MRECWKRGGGASAVARGYYRAVDETIPRLQEIIDRSSASAGP